MFTPHQSDYGGVMPWEYLPAAAGQYKVGQLLNVSNGKLVAISEASTTTPPYLCMAEVTAEDGKMIPVVRIHNDRIWKTTLSAEAASAKVGAKLQISAGGLEVDSASEGTFEVTELDGTVVGSTVYGRFV